MGLSALAKSIVELFETLMVIPILSATVMSPDNSPAALA
jgi:hypothetical protein